MTLLWILGVLFSIASFLIVRYVSKREREMLHEWRHLELDALRKFNVTGGDARYAFFGQEVETINRVEERRSPDGVLSSLTVTRILRNDAGEYFYWLWRSDDAPFVKSIPHSNAKLLLKKRYIPPKETVQ
jgi:hypothetical protein